MRKLFGRLHKSKSVNDDSRHRIDNNVRSDDDDKNKPGTSSNGGICHLAPSRTFEAQQKFRSNDSALLGTTSSCRSDGTRFDTELDRSMMQTITDVKYVNRRPKFIAVGKLRFFIRFKAFIYF